MQRLTLVRYTTKPDQTAKNEALARAVYDELRATGPQDVAYALFRSGDEWVHLFVNLKADDSAALTELPSFNAYSADIAGRCVAPPEVSRMAVELLEAYGFKNALT